MDQARVNMRLKANQSKPSAATDRPVSLPVTVGSSPLPVPTQRQAYEHRGSPRSPGRLRHLSHNESPRSRRSSESSSNVDVGSMTPPKMTFAVGTPPNSAGFKGIIYSRSRTMGEQYD